MDTRRKRFFGAVTICQPKSKETLSNTEKPNLTGWHFRKANHPLDGNKMAIAERSMSLHGEYDPANPQIRYAATLFLSAVRLASTTEASAGFGIEVYGTQTDIRHSILDNQNMTGLVHCFETAPAYVNTAQLRVKWKFDAGTTKPNVAVFRGVPRITHISETLIFLEEQMTQRWADGESDHPAHESALSARTAALADGDRIAIGIPWIHRDHELVAEGDLSKLVHAVAKVKALVAP